MRLDVKETRREGPNLHLAEELFSLGAGGFQPPHKRIVTNRALAPEELISFDLQLFG